MIYSTSKISEVSNLYFIVALFLYNLQVIVNIFLHKKKPRQSKELKAFFTIYLQDLFLFVLQTLMGINPPDSEFCRTEELKIMLCMLI
ncbi:MAG: hypothetical protein ACTSR8_10435 [Promethearchaeota archaeon]